jgi:hypothetical protein
MCKENLVEDALRAWASTYPRRATKFQRWATSIPEATELVLNAEEDPDDWPFISTYSFPDGHTKEDNIPRIDRLFFDFDVPDTGEYRSGRKRADAWARDMSKLLVRTRKIARFLLSANDPDCWQAVLSGHKGVHLDLVFPPIHESNGDFQQFRNGMGSYADSIIEYLKEATKLDDLDEWVDVSSADLGRLRRVPNTKHLGATDAFGEDRFCVPVSLKELAEIGPAEYIELTRARRPVTKSMHATPSEKAGMVLTQRIRTANTSNRSASAGSTVNHGLVEQYKERANDSITVDDLSFVLSDRPCILEYVKRDDPFAHRGASHMMEMFAITHMIDKEVPIETMVDFFSQTPGFQEAYTRDRIKQYISRSYNPVNCEKIWQQADQFCLHDSCQLWLNANAK